MGRRIRSAPIGLVATLAALGAAGCGGGGPESGEFDPSIAEEFVRDKVIADVQNDVALRTRNLEDPTVDCIQEDPGSEDPTDEGIFTCKADITNVDGDTLGREEWEIAVEIDPQSSQTVVRSAERLSSTIGEAPEP